MMRGLQTKAVGPGFLERVPLLLALLGVCLSCATLDQVVQNSPAAQTPVLLKVYRPGTPLVEVQPTQLAAPTYYAMPDTVLLVDVNAPWPTSLDVMLDQTPLQKVSSLAEAKTLDGQGKGSYQVLDTKDNGSTFTWRLAVSPPPAMRTAPGFTLALRDVSINPNVTGTAKTSNPLLLHVGSTLYSTDGTSNIRPTSAFCGNLPSAPGLLCKPNFQAPDGKVIPRVEIRGWVTQMKGWGDPPDDADPLKQELAFSILLDWGWTPDPWLVAAGVRPLTTLADVDMAFTPDNVITFGVDSTRRGDEGANLAKLDNGGLVWGGPGGMVVHVEVNGWLDHAGGRKNGQPAPTDWHTIPEVPDTKWAFDPVHPAAWPPGGELKVGDYVRLVGMLWEDHGLPQRNPAKECWAKGFTSGRGWIELHPVDFIARLPEPHHDDTLETLAICDDTMFSRVIRPPGPKPTPTSVVDFEQHIDGDFTVGRSIGMGSTTGSLSVKKLGDAIRVDVTTKGATLDYGAKFKASYRVFWK